MGTKRPGDFTRDEDDATSDSLSEAQRDVIGRVAEVVERERRNLQRASAVLAALNVAVMYEEEEMAADEVAYVARQLIDGVTDALDLVELRRAADKDAGEQPT